MRSVLKLGLPLALLLSGVSAGFGAASASAFDSRAAALRSEWSTYLNEGARAGSFTELAADLTVLQDRRLGPLPYKFFSGAALADPLARLEDATQQSWQSQVSTARYAAQAALSQFELQGPDSSAIAKAESEFASAGTPAQFAQLTQTWTADARQIAAARTAKIEAEKRAQAALLAKQKAEHDQLVSAEGNAGYLLTQASDLLQQYRTFGKPGTDQGTLLASLQANLNAATTLDQVNAIVSQANALVAQLNQLIAQASTVITTGGPGCLQNVPAKLIVVHLATQSLVAYDHGCVYLRTLVTTGRPALPTGMGTFKIFYKATQYLMHSPWPPGSPFWYPDTWVGYAMEFEGDGTFLHTADWEPAWAYGPGSQYGAYASHGCVHVLDGPAATLYGWAPIGTTVIVEN